MAAENDHTAIVQALIAQGADVNAVDKKGKTALHNSAFNRKTDTTQLLINHEANTKIKDVFGQKPYDLADTPEIKSLLRGDSFRRILGIGSRGKQSPAAGSSNQGQSTAAGSSNQGERAAAGSGIGSRAEQSPAAGSSNQGQRAEARESSFFRRMINAAAGSSSEQQSSATRSVRSWRSILTGTKNKDPMTTPLLGQDPDLER